MKITATIPVCQYGNIQPEIEGETAEQCMAEIRRLWELYAEPGRILPDKSQKGKWIVGFLGGGCFFDEDTHSYSHPDHKDLLSGSAFSKKFMPEFDAPAVAERYAPSIKSTPAEVLQWWADKADISAGYGTALHKAIEIYGKWSGKVPEEKLLSGNSHIRKAVKSFYENRKVETHHEVFLQHGHLVGFVDLLVKLPRGGWVIQDIKTDFDIDKKTGKILPPFEKLEPIGITKHWLQLSFYAHIMKLSGKEVKSLEVHHWTGDEWIVYKKEPLDITEALR